MNNELLPLAVMDVETTMIKHGEAPQTKFWGFADASGYKYFKTTKQFSDYMRRYPARLVLFHTNFDAIQMLMDGETLKFEKSHNGKIITFGWHKHKCLNSFAVFPQALGTIFATFGHKKTALTDLRKRNYDDCVIGLDCFEKLAAEFESLCGVNPIRANTIAGAGFKAAQRIAGVMPIDLKCEKAFRGGRVEVYDCRPYGQKQVFVDIIKQGEDVPFMEHLQSNIVQSYDINSSYPKSFLDCPEQDNLLQLQVTTKDWFCAFYDETNVDRLTFPNGTFTSWIYQHNLDKYVLPNVTKTKLKVLQRIKIDLRWLCACTPLIRDVYAVKKTEAKGARREASKLLLNSLYGRIGLRGEHEIIIISDRVAAGDDISYYKLPNGYFLSFKVVQKTPHSNYPFAAFITDNARCRLYEAFVKNDALYGDTDSVFTPHKKFVGSIGTECGQFDFKWRGSFQAHNLKDYTKEKIRTVKGGTRSVIWTLKQYLRKGKATQIDREIAGTLFKRKLLTNGVCVPIVIDNN